MIWFYRIIFLPAFLLLFMVILPRTLRRGGLRQDIGQRFGGGPALPVLPEGVLRVWMHAVSVGELGAIAPVIERLRARPDVEVFLTTTTTTAYALARERYGFQGVTVSYFPLDFWPFSVRAWKRVRPDVVVLTESDLWPEHLHQARLRQVPVLLVNARLSDRSFARLMRIRWVIRSLWRGIGRITAASALDARRFIALGFPAGSVERVGNLKVDVVVGPRLEDAERARLRSELGLPDGMVLMGSSTWPGEEEALVRALLAVRATGRACRLLIVPRHAERREEVMRTFAPTGLATHLRTRGPVSGPVDVYVADTTGEMVRLLQVADLVFVGRSLPPNAGGQTPVEAAALGVPILFGPSMNNFRAIAAGLVRAEAARVVATPDALVSECVRLLADPEQRARMGRAGQAWHESNRGAIGRTVVAVEACLEASRRTRCADGIRP